MTESQYGGLWGNPKRARLTTAKDALKSLLSNHLLKHVTNEDGTDNPDVNINITLITFPSGNPIFVPIKGLNASNIDTILDAIGTYDHDNPANNSGLKSYDGGTPYGYAFEKTKEWFDDIASDSTYDSYENLTFFLTDGNPTAIQNNETSGYVNDKYNELLQVNPNIHAIGIGSDVSQNTLNYYDTTNVEGSTTRTLTIANFTGSDNGSGYNRAKGVNRVDGWEHQGSATISKFEGALRITDTNPSAGSSAVVTMKTVHKIAVTEGAYFQFDAISSNWDSADEFHLAAAKMGCGS